jgi:hypothetical protein
MLDTMVQNTIAAKTVAPDGLEAWRSKLQQSIQFAVQTQRPDERAFFKALLAIIDDKEAILPDDNPYQPHLEQVKNAVVSLQELVDELGKLSSQDALLSDQIDVIIQNTIEAKTSAPEKLENWRENIKQATSIAKEECHDHEQAFFEALLAVLDGAELLLLNDNPYYEYLEHILDSIESKQLKPETAVPDIEQSSESSNFRTVSESIKRDKTMSKLPQDMMEVIVKTTIAVKTIAKANIEDWRGNIEKSVQLAIQNERVYDQAFFKALLAVINDEEVVLPETNPYYSHLQKVQVEIAQFNAETSDEKKALSSLMMIYRDSGESILRERLRQSGISQEKSDAIVEQIMKLDQSSETKPVLPSLLVESMVQTSIRVKTNVPEKLKSWRSELQRNIEGGVVNRRAEAKDFFEALLALIDGELVVLSEDNPYYAHLQKVQAGITTAQDRPIETVVEEETIVEKSTVVTIPISEEEWLTWIEQNTLAVLTVSSDYLEDWKQALQDEMMNSNHTVTDPKITFLAAVYNLVHNRLPALDALNPYYPNWQNLLIQVSRFKSGRRMKPEFLDTCVRTTIDVCTVNIEAHVEWRQRLRKFHALATGRKDIHEEDLFKALLDIAEGRLPSITLGNPYISELQRIQAEIANFHNQAQARTQEADDTEDAERVLESLERTIFKPREAKLLSLSEPFRSEMRGLLDALNIALKKIPGEYHNDVDIVNEEVGRAIDEATKPSPDLKRLKIRGDSLKVAAGNLQRIEPIVNRIAALLLRLGE